MTVSGLATVSSYDGAFRIIKEEDPFVIGLDVWSSQRGEETEYWDATVILAGKAAELAWEHLDKGEQIYVTGELVSEKDGQYFDREVKGASFEFTNADDEEEEEQQDGRQQQGRQQDNRRQQGRGSNRRSDGRDRSRVPPTR